MIDSCNLQSLGCDQRLRTKDVRELLELVGTGHGDCRQKVHNGDLGT